MDKMLKISIISLVLMFGLSLGLKVNAADCGVCKFGSGACTIDLRPGEGDGTLCNCANGGKCEKGDEDTCGCKKLEEIVNAQAGNGDVEPVRNNADNTPVTTNQNNSTGNNYSVDSVGSNATSYVLIGIGALVLIGGIFGIVKVVSSKKK